VIGPLQFVQTIRVKFPRMHRMLGYAFVWCQLLSLIGVLIVVLGPNKGHAGGFGSTVFTLIWGVWWMFCLYKAIAHIKNGNVEEHHIWMLRNAEGGMFVAFERATQLQWLHLYPPNFVAGLTPYEASGATVYTGLSDFTEWNVGLNQPAYVLAASFWITGFFTFFVMELYIYATYKVGLFAPTKREAPWWSISCPGVDQVLMSTNGCQDLKIAAKEEVGKGAVLLALQLPSPSSVLYIPPGGHVNVRSPLAASTLSANVRSYTPVTLRGSERRVGYLHLLVRKVATGALSPILCDQLAVGQSVGVEGPFSSGFTYESNLYEEVGLVAGGSGIAPMINVIHTALTDPYDRTKITLLYSCRAKDDFMLRAELDSYAEDFKDRFTLHYCLSSEFEASDGYQSRVTPAVLKELMPRPDDYNMCLVCGPPPMNLSVISMLGKVGHASERIFGFGTSDF